MRRLSMRVRTIRDSGTVNCAECQHACYKKFPRHAKHFYWCMTEPKVLIFQDPIIGKLEKKEYVKCTDRNRLNDCSLFLKAKKSEKQIKRFIEDRERRLFGV